jgi:hypothetical protein
MAVTDSVFRRDCAMLLNEVRCCKKDMYGFGGVKGIRIA